MKYFIDTEFLEGPQRESFPISLFRKNTPNTIDLISIGIVAEDGREYYAISKDFNLKEAWNRYDEKVEIMSGDMRNRFPNGRKYKEYWIRENVLRPIYIDLLKMHDKNVFNSVEMKGLPILKKEFSYITFKKLLNYFGKTNKEIADEVVEFCGPDFINGRNYTNPEFYAYYADYDWVVFCWLFGKMIDLPNGFPMYCKDLKQILDEKEMARQDGTDMVELRNLPTYPKQENEHNALDDARWNKQLFEFLNKL